MKSGSYNILGQHFGEEISNVMENAIEKIHNAGKNVGIAAGGCSEEVIKHWAKFEPDMLSAGADFDFIREGALRNFEYLNRCFKKA